MSSPIQDLENLGGGVFLSQKGRVSRLSEAEIWLAFEEPIMIWMHGRVFDSSEIERFVEIAKRFPCIEKFRFTGTPVTEKTFWTLREHWPNVPIEY